MTIWQTVKNWWNPTRHWQVDPARPLILDLDTHRFCGVAIGDSVESLSFLGPAARWSADLAFPNHGLCISNSPNLEEVQCFFGHPQEKDQGKFGGTIVHRNAPIELGADSSEEACVEWFGDCYWRDADDDEVLLFYEFSASELQIEFGTDDRLKFLSIGLPLLADPVQREAYGVSKPWPPA